MPLIREPYYLFTLIDFNRAVDPISAMVTKETVKLTMGEAVVLGQICQWLNDQNLERSSKSLYYITVDENILDPPPDKEIDLTSILHAIIEDLEYPQIYNKRLPLLDLVAYQCGVVISRSPKEALVIVGDGTDAHLELKKEE